MGKKNKRKKSRLRCPKCSGKRLTLLNKAKDIWECLNTNCGQKFLYFAEVNRYMTLDGEDFDKVTAPQIPIEGTLKVIDEESDQVESQDLVEEEKVETKVEVIEKEPVAKAVSNDPMAALKQKLGFTK